MTTGRINQVCTSLLPRPQARKASVRQQQQQYRNIPEGEKQAKRQASLRRKLTHERLAREESATMLFPSQRQAVRVQSNDAQTRLDRQLYRSTAANPSFEFCKSGGPQLQFSSQLAPTSAPNSPEPQRRRQSQHKLSTIQDAMR